jgi:hypothetical protein
VTDGRDLDEPRRKDSGQVSDGRQQGGTTVQDVRIRHRILRLALLAPRGGWMDQRVMLERPLQAAWEEQRTLLLAR